jgi:hypothetical protein
MNNSNVSPNNDITAQINATVPNNINTTQINATVPNNINTTQINATVPNNINTTQINTIPQNNNIAQINDTRLIISPNAIQAIATNEFKNKIINDYLRPSYLRDIEQKIYGRVFWNKVSNRIMVLSKVIMICVSIFAFAGSKFTNLWWLSFTAGILSVSALSLMQFSMFASHVSKDCTNDVNLLLTSLNMDNSKIPDLEINNNDEQNN